MAGDKPETVVRKYYEKAAQGDEKAIDELLSEDFVLYSPVSEEPLRGIGAYKDMIAAFLAATPEMKVKVEDLTVEGDTVITRWSARFKHTGQFEGHPPTGKTGDVSGSDRIRVRDGKIVEIHNNVDLAGVERKVGFQPKLKKR